MSQDLEIDSNRDRTLDLATFFSSLGYDDLPGNVIHMAKASILNSIGCGLSSAMLEPSKKMFQALEITSKEHQPATILARSDHASIDGAALLNGLAMTARFFDDTHLETVVHPSGPPLAAALAYAEAYHMSGKDVLLAFVVGVETMLAVAAALGLGPYKQGWHLTSITGTFGATAAVATLMKLPAQQFAWALGHASSMAAGSRGVFGTDTLIMHAGRAAQNGILAARLAREDFGSTTHALEKWINLISDRSGNAKHLDALSDVSSVLQRKWMILDNAFKPYPCGIVIHPVIDAGIEAHNFFFNTTDSPVQGKPPQDALDIFPRIEAAVAPLTLRLCGVRHPQEFMQIIFSTYHGLGVGLVHGKAGIKEFSMDVANEALIKSLRDRILLKTDDQLEDDQAIVSIWYISPSGEDMIVFRIEHATGSLLNPMTDRQLELKFIDQAKEGNISNDNIQKAIEALWSLNTVEDIASMMKLLVCS